MIFIIPTILGIQFAYNGRMLTFVRSENLEEPPAVGYKAVHLIVTKKHSESS